MRTTPRLVLRRLPLLVIALVWSGRPPRAQVSPAEIRNPALKTLEQTHLKQLIALNRQIAGAEFPFPFALGRYVGLDPQEQFGSDARGLEFVHFHDRSILKISGNYNAAFSADALTQNERACRTFDEVVAPILRLLPQQFPGDVDFDGFGFEISYHVRTSSRAHDFEGKEILVVVFAREDVYRYPKAGTQEEKQQILNASEIYVSGKEFGLALGKSEPLEAEEIEKGRPGREASAVEKEAAGLRASKTAASPGASPRDSLGLQLSPRTSTSASGLAPATSQLTPAAPALTQADADSLQKQYQSDLDTWGKEGAAKFHFAAYAPPSLMVFRHQLYMQVTLRNPAPFNRDTTSIYKRAAQSFDLFLAPMLKDVVAKVPPVPGLVGLDVTVLNQFNDSSSASEAVEYIMPMSLVYRFAEYDITNQELLNQSFILVNGVRIALNLQQVE